MTTIHFNRNEQQSCRSTPSRLPHLQRFAASPDAAWCGEATTICGDVLHAAHAEMEHLKQSLPGPAPTVEALVGLIAYCYAKGLFSSADIEEELWSTPAFIEAFGNKLPTAHEIRTFRRRNRPLILSVLEHAIDEFCRREPEDVRRRVLVAREEMTVSAKAMADWLLDMANVSDSLEDDDC